MPQPSTFGWPYAAKAVIQHEYIDTSLIIYITFSETMNVMTKPDEGKWLVKIDTVETVITSSIWFDAFTMVLTIEDVVTEPIRVTVAYDGPDENLQIAQKSGTYKAGIKYSKQWQPFAAIPSVSFV